MGPPDALYRAPSPPKRRPSWQREDLLPLLGICCQVLGVSLLALIALGLTRR